MKLSGFESAQHRNKRAPLEWISPHSAVHCVRNTIEMVIVYSHKGKIIG